MFNIENLAWHSPHPIIHPLAHLRCPSSDCCIITPDAALSPGQGNMRSQWVAGRGKSLQVSSQLGLEKWGGCCQWYWKRTIQQGPGKKNRLNGKKRTSNSVWLMHKIHIVQWVSARDGFASQRTPGNVWRHFQWSSWVRGYYWHVVWVDVRDVAKDTTVHRTASQLRTNQPKMSIAPRLRNLDVEEWGK